ncbi:unnamed protein product [Orchesella dallaii]|uniref:Uncharacterized protein n=1 Tax=Orchesella dallaii TaxID=48710 RepID=A0ABP1RVD6_9HEXA
MGMVQEKCSEIIKSVDTIHGKCCRFRMAPALPKLISASDDNMTNISESFNASLDSIAGVDQNISMENMSLFDMAEFNSSYFMVHQAKLSDEFSIYKQPSHFSVLLNLNEETYQCDNLLTSTNQILFALHSPGNFPKMQDYHSMFVANQEVIITVFPATTYGGDREEEISKDERECSSYEWLTDYGEGFKTTKAAYFDGCLRKFISQNCKCGFMGYEMEYWESLPELSTCKTDSNSNDTICMKRMRELVSKLKHICHIHQTPCSGTAHAYETTNQPMKNAWKLWASLRRFGNDTTLAIPWVNNKTGIIHFAFNTSPQTKSTNNAEMGGFLSVILITAVSCLICLAIVVLPHLWRCICSMMVKASLYLRGVLHARKISALNTNFQP